MPHQSLEVTYSVTAHPVGSSEKAVMARRCTAKKKRWGKVLEAEWELEPGGCSELVCRGWCPSIS